MKPLVIIGTGLFSQVAKDYFNSFTGHQVVAFSCHREYLTDQVLMDLPVIPFEELTDHFPPQTHDAFVAIGFGKMNKKREFVYEQAKSAGYRLVTFIHPKVHIWSSTQIGDNVFIFEDNTIQPYTSIGNNTIFWSGNHLGHHSSVGNHSFISSHVVIAGSSTVGNNVFIGVNATLHDHIQIGDECLIGAGAIISKSTEPRSVYVPQATPVFPKTSDQLRF